MIARVRVPDLVDVATGVLMERYHQDLERASSMLIALARKHGCPVGDYATGLVRGGGTAFGDATVPAVIHRAVAFIDANADRAVTSAEIADAAGVGVRGLQVAFRRHRGESPTDCLRRARMDGAHRDLAAGDATSGDTVRAIAARWGFAHVGRFSVAYRRLYGCAPGTTLRT